MDWPRLWAFARYALRVSNEELNGLTFVEFARLADQHRAETKAADRRAALVACMAARAAGNDDCEVEDFMPVTEYEQEQRRAEKMRATLAWFEAKAAQEQS